MDLMYYVDLTSLTDQDDHTKITHLCAKAKEAHVAAVCVYPQFVSLAVNLLRRSEINIATVANFPHGEEALSIVLETIKKSIEEGATEIDVVFPFKQYLAGERSYAIDFIAACRSVSQQIILKVILETGVLVQEDFIVGASHIALLNGADFIKTSTGKAAVGATLPAAKMMLETIRSQKPTAGFKAAGGIRTFETAMEYVYLAESILGKSWVTLKHFRIGASQLLSAKS